MKRKIQWTTVLTVTVLMLTAWPIAQAASPDFWGGAGALESLQKVAPPVISSMEKDGRADFFIVLTEQADLSGALKIRDKVDKGRYVFRQLTRIAERTQPGLIAELGLSELRIQ
ncbi:hypothetical protein JXA80_09415, partial [bacterium]|nr:hypothetical protein [candidate division CSSED10-310 bacterium]